MRRKNQDTARSRMRPKAAIAPASKDRANRLRLVVCIAIFIAGLVRWAPPYRAQFDEVRMYESGDESLRVAYSLAHGYGFANPFKTVESGPTAHLAPVFPFLLSIIVRWIGDGSRALYVVDWMGVSAASLQVCLWPYLARRLRMGFAAGAIAAVLWLICGLAPNTIWDADYLAVLVILVSMGTLKVLSGGCSAPFIAAVGALWGITILAGPVVLIPFAILAGWTIFFSSASRRQKILFVVLPMLVLAPWTIRNYRTFHHIFLVRDNLGLELGVFNNECAEFSFAANQDNGCYFHPNEDAKEAQRLLNLGEYDYYQKRLQEALQWISSSPGKFGFLTFQRFIAFWFPNGSGNPFTSSVHNNVKVLWLLTLFSVPGLLFLWWTDRRSAIFCLVWLLFFPPVYYLVGFDLRYRTPIIWATMIPASFVLLQAGSQLIRRAEPYPATTST